jgi:hypothetical protein
LYNLANREGPISLRAVEAHIDTLRAVIGNKVEGDGGAVGRNLLDALAEVSARTVSPDH